MQFVGDFTIDPAVCDRLVELHRACDHLGLVKRGSMGKAGAVVINVEKKDSFDVAVSAIPEAMQDQYGIPRYFTELKRCVDEYLQQHPILQSIGRYALTESPAIQHYRPGGGFTMAHFERSAFANTTRMLVWMTFLNDVTDAGGTYFTYQNHTFGARKGRTLIWPPDFTHTHAGVVSPTQHKYIITGWLNFIPPDA